MRLRFILSTVLAGLFLNYLPWPYGHQGRAVTLRNPPRRLLGRGGAPLRRGWLRKTTLRPHGRWHYQASEYSAGSLLKGRKQRWPGAPFAKEGVALGGC